MKPGLTGQLHAFRRRPFLLQAETRPLPSAQQPGLLPTSPLRSAPWALAGPGGAQSVVAARLVVVAPASPPGSICVVPDIPVLPGAAPLPTFVPELSPPPSWPGVIIWPWPVAGSFWARAAEPTSRRAETLTRRVLRIVGLLLVHRHAGPARLETRTVSRRMLLQFC